MAAEISATPKKVETRVRWVRQEYKTNKDKFEKPFKINLEADTQQHKLHDIVLEQNYSALGTTVWDGSIALAKMFENKLNFPEKYLKKCKVLELGAGCGLVGITLLLLGAKSVVLSDLELCLPTLQKNVDNNIVGSAKERISVVPFIWGQDTSPLIKECKYDIVVAAEVLYDEQDSALLAKSAVELIEQGGIMFVSMGRNRNGETAFIKVLVANGYTVNEVLADKLHPKYQDEIIKVIAVTKINQHCDITNVNLLDST